MVSPIAVLALVALSGPTGLVNARSETRTVAAGLEREVKALLAGSPERFWVGYTVPSTRENSMCCGHQADRAGESCSGCRLEDEQGNGFRSSSSKTAAVPLGSRNLRVLLRAEGGRITRVRALSEDCALDAGGLRFVWLEGVGAADSVAFLEGLAANTDGDGPGRDRTESALAAITFTADASADAALDRMLDPARPEELRKKAAFWLGMSRRPGAVPRLVRLVTDDPSPKLREHVIFVLSQTRDPAAIDKIIDVAKHDPSAHVRGQALFWLAQTAGRRAASVLESAATEDPEVEVKKKAVFALSQLPKDEGVPLLVRLARTHQSREVRKQAMFWLGQSGDPRALAFFEEVLKP